MAAAPPAVPRVYIRLPKTITEASQVEVMFTRFGPVAKVWIARNPAGFAYIVSV